MDVEKESEVEDRENTEDIYESSSSATSSVYSTSSESSDDSYDSDTENSAGEGESDGDHVIAKPNETPNQPEIPEPPGVDELPPFDDIPQLDSEPEDFKKDSLGQLPPINEIEQPEPHTPDVTPEEEINDQSSPDNKVAIEMHEMQTKRDENEDELEFTPTSKISEQKQPDTQVEGSAFVRATEIDGKEEDEASGLEEGDEIVILEKEDAAMAVSPSMVVSTSAPDLNSQLKDDEPDSTASKRRSVHWEQLTEKDRRDLEPLDLEEARKTAKRMSANMSPILRASMQSLGDFEEMMTWKEEDIINLESFLSSVRIIRDYSSTNIHAMLEDRQMKSRMRRIQKLTLLRNTMSSHPFITMQYQEELSKEWKRVMEARMEDMDYIPSPPEQLPLEEVCQKLITFTTAFQDDPFVHKLADSENCWTDIGYENRLKAEMATSERWYESFANCLEHEVGIEYFHNFMRTEYSAENILFHKAVNRYKADLLAEEDGGVKLTAKMFDIFIKDGCLYEVNISCKQKEDIFAKVETPCLGIFSSAVISLLDIMQKGTWLRFKKTDMYEDMVRRYYLSKRGKVPFERPKQLDGVDIYAEKSLLESLESFENKENQFLNLG